MRNVVVAMVFTVMACGSSDPLSDVESCFDLDAVVADMSSEEKTAVEAEATDLLLQLLEETDDEIAILACFRAATELVGRDVEDVFDEIGEGLSS